MNKGNFFDRFWIPYIGYEVLTGFNGKQVEQEILDLEINESEVVANIGINWGRSLQIIFEKYPTVKKVYGIDSSKIMLRLTEIVFSEKNLNEENLTRNLSRQTLSFLESLQKEAKKNAQKVTLIYSSAEEIYKKKIKIDKIAATMGFQWLEEPQTKGFVSMNRCLPLDGRVTFSTASANFETSNPEESFINNPYYLLFFKIFDEKFNRTFPMRNKLEKTGNKIYNINEIIRVVKLSGFQLEGYKEYKFEIEERLIDKVCIAGIKFSYDCNTDNPRIKKIIEEVLKEIKSKHDYSIHTSRYEICPIFRIKKIKEV